MNKKTIVIYFGMGCLLAVLTMWSYFSTERRMLEVAERTFVEAVHQDLDRRLKEFGEPISFHGGKDKNKYVGLKILKDDGTEEIRFLEGIEYDRNVDGDATRRMLHTVFSDMGLHCNSDTLNSIWQDGLKMNGVKLKTFTVVGCPGKGSTVFRDSLAGCCTSLPLYYAGVSNEIELSGFAKLSLYAVCGSEGYLMFLFLVWMVWLAYGVWKFIPFFFLSKGRYLLAEGIVYDPASCCIYNHQEQIRLFPKSNAIIKALLEAEHHQLHGADLLAAAWGDDEINLDKLYTQNSLIRKTLKELGEGFRLESVDGGYFKLIVPNGSNLKCR